MQTPLEKKEKAAQPKYQEEEWPDLAGMDFSLSETRKILIVDDEKEIRELVRETLMVDNFQVVEAATGDQAYELVKKAPPDLLILDVKMPGQLDGITLTAKLKQNPATRHIPIFLLTAVPVELGDDSQLYPDAIFYKPFSPMDLLDRITGLFVE